MRSARGPSTAGKDTAQEHERPGGRRRAHGRPDQAAGVASVARRGSRPVWTHVRRNWARGLLGGAGSIASYGLALWAMTKAPVATVAALRETAILFALLISVFVLKEKASIWRYIAGAVIAAGVLVLKLA